MQGSTYTQPRHQKEVGWLVLRAAVFTLWKPHRHSFYRRLGEFQDLFGHEEVKKNLHPTEPGDRTLTVQPENSCPVLDADSCPQRLKIHALICAAMRRTTRNLPISDKCRLNYIFSYRMQYICYRLPFTICIMIEITNKTLISQKVKKWTWPILLLMGSVIPLQTIQAHGDMQGSTYTQPQHQKEVGWLALRAAVFTLWKPHRHSFYRRLGEFQDQSGQEEVKKNHHPTELGDRTLAVQPENSCPVTDADSCLNV